jgi:hypothetical protein
MKGRGRDTARRGRNAELSKTGELSPLIDSTKAWTWNRTTFSRMDWRVHQPAMRPRREWQGKYGSLYFRPACVSQLKALT